MLTCWSCGAAVDGVAPFCPACSKVQPPGDADHFARLGLPAGFAVERAQLDKSYFALQRQLHPDRFATASSKERAISQSQAVSLNDAYETLKEPLRRASYLLNLRGAAPAADEHHTVKDPVLLMEQMERREALNDAQSAADVEAIVKAASADVTAGEAAIAAAFAADDLRKAAAETTRLKYLVKLVDEARARKARFAAMA